MPRKAHGGGDPAALWKTDRPEGSYTPPFVVEGSLDHDTVTIQFPKYNPPKQVTFALDFSGETKEDEEARHQAFLNSKRTKQDFERADGKIVVLTPNHLVDELTSKNNEGVATTMTIGEIARVLGIRHTELMTAERVARDALLNAAKERKRLAATESVHTSEHPRYRISPSASEDRSR